MIRRTVPTVAALAAITFTAGSCSDNEAEPIPEAKGTPASEATSTEPAWASRYTDEQVDAYREALKRYNAFNKESLPYLRNEIIVRADAEAVWLKYWIPRRNALVQFNEAMLSRDQGLRLKRPHKVLWAKPKTIGSDANSVVLTQCLEGPSAVITQNGRKITERDAPNILETVNIVRADEKAPWLLTRWRGDPKAGCK